MKKNSGYKGMLRDRCPKAVDRALKWQKAKERWINHAYNRFIGIYSDNEERKKATRIVLCLKYTRVGQGRNKYVKEEQNFNFDKTIDWENLTKEETIYWERIASWVRWFRKIYPSVKTSYENSRKIGRTDFELRVEMINLYLRRLLPTKDMDEETKQAKLKYVDNFVEFLIKCIDNRI